MSDETKAAKEEEGVVVLSDKQTVRLDRYDAVWEGEDGELCLRVGQIDPDTTARGQIHGFGGEAGKKLRAAIDPGDVGSDKPPKPGKTK